MIACSGFHNLKKAKGQYTSFGIIIAITACIMNIALVLAMQTGAAYDRRFQELNTADVNVIIPEAQHTASVRDSIAATDGVEDMEHRRVSLASATVRDFAGADFDMTTVFYNIDDPRTLNTLAVERADNEQDGVYVPEYMSEMGGFAPGSPITYAIDGTEHTYTVANTVGEMQYGNYGTGLIGAYLPPDAFEDFAARHGTVMEYSIRASDDADTQQLQSDIAAALADQGVTVLNTSNRVSAKQTRTMVCTLLVAIFLALAFIVLAVSVFLSNFRIRNTIANDMTQMGVLKALGYTSSMIIRSCVIPYALVGAVSAMVGAGLSYAALPALAHVLAVQSGFSFTPTFDPVATAIAVLAPTGAIVIFAYVAARSIRRVEPINAIRGIRPNTATVNHFPLETTNMPVKTTLLAKRIASSAGTNILLGAVAVVVTLLMSFAGVLLYNVVIKPANLMDTLSEETPSVIFTAAPGKLGELSETLDADGRTRTVLHYASVPVSYDGGNLTAFVSEDFSQVHNDIVYEGRNPATGARSRWAARLPSNTR
ncbi:ABC transporter permease [Bifidobacterium magnum]|uniref:ABC transporter permease n=1 Tax=Bifidobacterium magnum TaxID=1692 RepID=UPI000689B184|nr:ABC transporter permease [Bifidobacterium magnum]